MFMLCNFSIFSNLFFFGSLETYVRHKDWLIYPGGTNRLGELCQNSLNQMVNFPTRILDSDSHNPTLLDLYISSDAIICSTMTFSLLGNSHHVMVSVSIDFLSNSKRYALFHRIGYNYSCANWDGLCDHLRDAPYTLYL